MREARRAAVLGLGLMGGSLARALAGRGVEVWGRDRDPAAERAAGNAGVLRGVLPDSLEGLEEVDLVALAAPVDATGELLAAARPRLSPGCLVLDLASVQRPGAVAARRHGLESRYLGSHPLAGDARSGWGAGRADLYEGARVFLGPTPATPPPPSAAPSTSGARSAPAPWCSTPPSTTAASPGPATSPRPPPPRSPSPCATPASPAPTSARAGATPPAWPPAPRRCGPPSPSPTPTTSSPPSTPSPATWTPCAPPWRTPTPPRSTRSSPRGGSGSEAHASPATGLGRKGAREAERHKADLLHSPPPAPFRGQCHPFPREDPMRVPIAVALLLCAAPVASATEVEPAAPAERPAEPAQPAVVEKAPAAPRAELAPVKVERAEAAATADGAQEMPRRGSFWWIVGAIVVAGIILAVVL